MYDLSGMGRGCIDSSAWEVEVGWCFRDLLLRDGELAVFDHNHVWCSPFFGTMVVDGLCVFGNLLIYMSRA